MRATPKGLRVHLGFFGRRNVGKSSLLNALTKQEVSIVSATPGTTTDPVEKPMELQPLGPVLFIDTAGIDDVGEIGNLRIQKTRRAVERTDIAVLATEAGAWGPYEEQLLTLFETQKVPCVVVFNKVDIAAPDPRSCAVLRARVSGVVEVSATEQRGLEALRNALVQAAPQEFLEPPALVGDLVGPGKLAVLVVPIDTEAPKGRLIHPQVQTIRDLLDNDAYCLVVKDRELASALDRLKEPPALVVTDSQAFLKVAGDIPPNVPMTSFSIVFARNKGDLPEFVRGALAIETLHDCDRILVAETCTHKPTCEDIGRVKIPGWLRQYLGGNLEFHHVQGHDFPDDLSPYRLVIHCGACMWNRREVLARIARCRQADVPITNYGMTIAYSLGILERALEPFPAALETYRERSQPQPVPA